MEGLILFEYDAGAEGIRDALLARTATLALKGEGRLGCVARVRGSHEPVSREVLAVFLREGDDASRFAGLWRAEGILEGVTLSGTFEVLPLPPDLAFAPLFP